MTQEKKPSFSDKTLFAAEAAQYVLHRSRIGRSLVSRLTGSSCPACEQLLWLPPWLIKDVNITDSVNVLASPDSKKTAKNWEHAAVLAATKESMDWIRAENPHSLEAVAYRSSVAWHIGVSATQERCLLAPISPYSEAIAVRQGSGSAKFTLGMYSPHEKRLVTPGISDIQIQEMGLPVDELPRMYPGVKLV